MRNFILLTTIYFLSLCACNPNSVPEVKYKLVYRIHYSDSYVLTKSYGPITYHHLSSTKGSNSLWIKMPNEFSRRLLEDTSAPIEIVSFTKIK